MRFDERRVADVVILDVAGRLVLGDAVTLLRGRVTQLLHDGTRKLVINLAACEYVDSAGLAELATAVIRVRRAEGQLRFANVPARVRDLLRLTRLLPVFDLASDEREAISSM